MTDTITIPRALLERVAAINPFGDRENAAVRDAARAALEQQIDTSGMGLSPKMQAQISEWLADGTFVRRAIGVMKDQERQLIALEQPQQEKNT